jgi:hypothetical protein
MPINLNIKQADDLMSRGRAHAADPGPTPASTRIAEMGEAIKSLGAVVEQQSKAMLILAKTNVGVGQEIAKCMTAMSAEDDGEKSEEWTVTVNFSRDGTKSYNIKKIK